MACLGQHGWLGIARPGSHSEARRCLASTGWAWPSRHGVATASWPGNAGPSRRSEDSAGSKARHRAEWRGWQSRRGAPGIGEPRRGWAQRVVARPSGTGSGSTALIGRHGCRGEVRVGMDRLGLAWPGSHGPSWDGQARLGAAVTASRDQQVMARPGSQGAVCWARAARFGAVRQSWHRRARQLVVWFGSPVAVLPGTARQGTAVLAWLVWARLARPGEAVEAGYGIASHRDASQGKAVEAEAWRVPESPG